MRRMHFEAYTHIISQGGRSLKIFLEIVLFIAACVSSILLIMFYYSRPEWDYIQFFLQYWYLWVLAFIGAVGILALEDKS